MPTQLPLSFNWQVPIYSFSNYEAESNQFAYQSLLQFLQGENGQCLFLWGSAGTGKTHLLQAACKYASQQGATPAYLPFSELRAYSPEVLEGIEELDLVCIDDIHLIAGLEQWEHALFVLFNRLRETRTLLLISAVVAPQALGLQLADLSSRLAWDGVFMLESPADDTKIRILQHYSAERGMDLSESVAIYLLKQRPANLNILIHWVERLDYASLANKRRLTLSFVRKFLNSQS